MASESPPVSLTSPVWCTCHRCTPEPNLEEEKCCRSLPRYLPDDGTCITLSQKFQTQVLNHEVLLLHMDEFGVDGRSPEDYAHCFYRWFTRWMYGYLGWGNRIPIPACVLRACREKFAHY